MKRLWQVTAMVVALTVMFMVSHEAHAATWSDWHVMMFDPYGPTPVTTDLVRVKTVTAKYTSCDFMAQNKYDVRLIGTANPESGLRGSVRSCIPGRLVFLR